MTVVLDGPGVTVDEVVAVARDLQSVALAPSALERMAASRAVVEQLASGEPVYGISTGFGALAAVAIPPERRSALQASLVRSHAAGMGPPVEDEVVRAMMFLRARTLALGFSGTRPVLAESIVRLLNEQITPIVHEHGSLGASGDLAPLAHAALALLGEGTVTDRGREEPASAALARIGMEPLDLVEKEGLALTNGTDGILGMLCLAIDDVRRLLCQADVTAALTVEALMGTDRAFADDLQALRPQPGQRISATNLRRMLEGSPIVASHRNGDDRVQDAYSVRCTPRSTERPETRWITRAVSWTPNSPRPSTIRWFCPTAGWSRAATSTACRWASSPTSLPSPSPKSGPSRNVAWTAFSTARAPTG